MELQISLDRLSDYSKQHGSVVNVSKPYSMVVRGFSRKEYSLYVTVAGTPMLQVKEFVYLEYQVNEKLSLENARKKQATKTGRSFHCFRQKIANLQSKCPYQIMKHLFQTMVTTVADFGAEIHGPNRHVKNHQLKFFRAAFDLRGSTPKDAIYALGGFCPQGLRQAYLQTNFVLKGLRRPSDSLHRNAILLALENAKSRKKQHVKYGCRDMGKPGIS